MGDAFSCTVTVSGGRAPYTWSVTGLPAGLTARPSGSALTISGVPTGGGNFVPTITVTDSSSPAITTTPEMPLYVAYQPMGVTVNAPSTAYLGEPYSGTVTVVGGESPYKWSTASGMQGLTLTAHGSTLTISGSPAGPGSLMSGTVTDSESPSQTWNWSYELTIYPPPSPTSAAARAGLAVYQSVAGKPEDGQ